MLLVGGRPFVEYLVLQLRLAGLQDVVFASGYRSEQLNDYFGSGDRFDVRIRYSVEAEPLGTGGAIRLAADLAQGDAMVVMNGDSFLDVDPRRVLNALAGDIIASMALTEVADPGRYGSVEILGDGTIRQFDPRGTGLGSRLVNAGIYGLRRAAVDRIPANARCSFEHEVLPGLVEGELRGVPVEGFFVDIGVPEAYQKLLGDPSPLLRAVRTVRIA
jgi:D-glycero-alpha-D-manno-heptose 1-phosphate guanylyltransferase